MEFSENTENAEITGISTLAANAISHPQVHCGVALHQLCLQYIPRLAASNIESAGAVIEPRVTSQAQ